MCVVHNLHARSLKDADCQNELPKTSVSLVALKSGTTSCVYNDASATTEFITPSKKELSNIQICYTPCPTCTWTAPVWPSGDDPFCPANDGVVSAGSVTLPIPTISCSDLDPAISETQVYKCPAEGTCTTENQELLTEGTDYTLVEGVLQFLDCGKKKVVITASASECIPLAIK